MDFSARIFSCRRQFIGLVHFKSLPKNWSGSRTCVTWVGGWIFSWFFFLCERLFTKFSFSCFFSVHFLYWLSRCLCILEIIFFLSALADHQAAISSKSRAPFGENQFSFIDTEELNKWNSSSIWIGTTLSFLSYCQICVEICSFSTQYWQMQSHWIYRDKIQSILWHSSGVFNSLSIKIIFNPECMWNLWNPKLLMCLLKT